MSRSIDDDGLKVMVLEKKFNTKAQRHEDTKREQKAQVVQAEKMAKP